MHEINSISDYHKIANLPKPKHPLISLVNYEDVNYDTQLDSITMLQGNYTVALKHGVSGKMRYGQKPYDFDEGLMAFVAPNQVVNIQINKDPQTKPTGWLLIINPDFVWNTPLAQKIKKYEFFGYQINEALFLSEGEEGSMIGIMKNIQKEYSGNMDQFSQSIIISQIELLFNYAERYYQRQFLTRNIANHEVLDKLETLLDEYFEKVDLASQGIPSVQAVADRLNISPNYLSSLLKVLTGLNTQQHIHEKLISKAKEKLSTTQLSVSEIAYALGFEHAQSFSRLFKHKTNSSPQAFRDSFLKD